MNRKIILSFEAIYSYILWCFGVASKAAKFVFWIEIKGIINRIFPLLSRFISTQVWHVLFPKLKYLGFFFVLGKAKLNLDFAMKNITKYKSENIRIRCEISGNPLPRYKWYKDDVPIRENEDRINSKLTPWGARWVVPLTIVFRNYKGNLLTEQITNTRYWKDAVNGKFICLIKMQFNYQEVKNAFQQKKVKIVFYLKFGSTL